MSAVFCRREENAAAARPFERTTSTTRAGFCHGLQSTKSAVGMYSLRARIAVFAPLSLLRDPQELTVQSIKHPDSSENRGGSARDLPLLQLHPMLFPQLWHR